jgi:hypothetical protein
MEDQQLWRLFCRAEADFYTARMALVRDASELPSLIRRALDSPSQRGTALRLLQILPESVSRTCLEKLVGLASVGHSDVALCRDVILRIDHEWLIANVDAFVEPLLENCTEEFRRFAELYDRLDENLLRIHLNRCADHQYEEIRDIAADFTRGP